MKCSCGWMTASLISTNGLFKRIYQLLLNKKISNKEDSRQILELDFGNTPEKLKGEQLDMYEKIQSGVKSTRFDENSDLSKTY